MRNINPDGPFPPWIASFLTGVPQGTLRQWSLRGLGRGEDRQFRKRRMYSKEWIYAITLMNVIRNYGISFEEACVVASRFIGEFKDIESAGGRYLVLTMEGSRIDELLWWCDGGTTLAEIEQLKVGFIVVDVGRIMECVDGLIDILKTHGVTPKRLDISRHADASLSR